MKFPFAMPFPFLITVPIWSEYSVHCQISGCSPIDHASHYIEISNRFDQWQLDTRYFLTISMWCRILFLFANKWDWASEWVSKLVSLPLSLSVASFSMHTRVLCVCVCAHMECGMDWLTSGLSKPAFMSLRISWWINEYKWIWII